MFEKSDIPNKPLIECCRFIDYRGKTPEKSESGIPLITAKNVKDNHFSWEPREYIPSDNYDSIMVRGIPEINDVLFTTEAPLGNVCRIPQIEGKFCIGQRIITLQSKGELIPEYLEQALLSDSFRSQMISRSSGSTVKGIRSAELEKIKIPIPDLESQNQFAIFVNHVDKSKVICKQMVSRFDDLVKSRYVEMFGKLEKGSFKYPACKLSDICDGRSSTIQINKMKDNDGEFPLFGASGIVKKIDSFSQNKEYVGIVKDGAGVGRVSHYPAYSSLVGTMAYLVPKDNCTISYLEQTLKMMDLGNSSTGSTIPHIYFKDYGKTLIPLPPIDMQNKFEMFVKQVDKSKSALINFIAERLKFDSEVP